jgi:transposase-like protein
MEELVAERGVDGDHVTIYRWVQRFTPLRLAAAFDELAVPERVPRCGRPELWAPVLGG